MKGAEIIASPQVFPLPFLAHVNYVEHVYADKLTFGQHSKTKWNLILCHLLS